MLIQIIYLRGLYSCPHAALIRVWDHEERRHVWDLNCRYERHD